MTKPKSQADKLIEELRRSRAIGLRPGEPKPEDPFEIGRQMARDLFEECLKPGEPVIQRTQGD